jgi:hypothetical protein
MATFEKTASMKKQKWVIFIISVIISIEIVGAILNRVVMSANGGMPVIYLREAFGKWVPLNLETKFAFLSDVIPIGCYAVSIGDLLLLSGIAINMISIWIAVPRSRKVFPLLIASFLGIIWSIAEPNLMLAFLFEAAALGTLLVIYFKYRSTLKKVA